MAKFTYTMEDSKAVLEVKRAINGKVAVLKDKGSELTVGAPMMTVSISVKNGILETKASLAGKALIGTVDSCIELTEGFTKA